MAGTNTTTSALQLVDQARSDPTLERDPHRLQAMIEMEEVAQRGVRTPKSLTPLQEKYCQLRADGCNKKDAFERSGLGANVNPDHYTAQASKLEQRIYIATRIGVLKAAKILNLERVSEVEQPTETAQGELQVTPDWVRRQFLEVLTEARAAGNHAQAVKAIELMGKSIGMFADKADGRKDRSKPNQGQTDSNADPQKSLNVSILNQFFGDANDELGDEPASRDITPQAVAQPVADNGRTGSAPASSLLDRLAGALAEGVPDTSEG